MSASEKYRGTIADAKRIVVKIGSRVLIQKTGRPDVQRMRLLVRDLARLHRSGAEVLVVTSGAVGAGMEAMGLPARPTALPDIQMCAAVGQVRLMARYMDYFRAEHCTVGQVLLTHEDFHHKIRLINIRRTMENLIRSRVIPIINENDVVADEELKAELRKFGDNDLLASMVVRLVRADLLILLTTASGFCIPDAAGRMRRVSYLESITPKTLSHAAAPGSPLSTGGMRSKLQAAALAAEAGCCSVLANGRETGIIGQIVRGEDVGTLVLASPLAE